MLDVAWHAGIWQHVSVQDWQCRKCRKAKTAQNSNECLPPIHNYLDSGL